MSCRPESSLKKGGHRKRAGPRGSQRPPSSRWLSLSLEPQHRSSLGLSFVSSRFSSWQPACSSSPAQEEEAVVPSLCLLNSSKKKRWPVSGNAYSKFLGEELELTHMGQTCTWFHNFCLGEGISMTQIGPALCLPLISTGRRHIQCGVDWEDHTL